MIPSHLLFVTILGMFWCSSYTLWQTKIKQKLMIIIQSKIIVNGSDILKNIRQYSHTCINTATILAHLVNQHSKYNSIICNIICNVHFDWNNVIYFHLWTRYMYCSFPLLKTVLGLTKTSLIYISSYIVMSQITFPQSFMWHRW